MCRHALLQGIFTTQGLNLCLFYLPHWQADYLPLCHLNTWAHKKLTLLWQFLPKWTGCKQNIILQKVSKQEKLEV